MPATVLARLLADREASADEVVDAHLRRIAVVDAAINAVVQVDAERALARARELDAGPPAGPLHGVPFTVKDNLAAAGIPMAIGAPERAGVVPAQDATVVARMRAAGAILIGKTNCPPYGGGIETDNEVYGRTSNPYDPSRTPGGSSGGEAAAIAAGASPCGLGTDSGGSIRLPAHFCGVAALKPTAGRVPSPASSTTRARSAPWATRARRSGRSRGRSPTRAGAAGRRGAGRPRRRDRPRAARRPRRGRARRAAGGRAHRGRVRGADRRHGRRGGRRRGRAARRRRRWSCRRARPAAGTSSRWRSGAPTRAARRTGCCAAGTPTAPRCWPSPSASTSCSRRCSPTPRARTGR